MENCFTFVFRNAIVTIIFIIKKKEFFYLTNFFIKTKNQIFMEKQVFVLESVVTKNSQKKLKKRTLEGKLKAIFSGNFIADGVIEGADGNKVEVKNQTFRKLKSKGVELIKIPGVKNDMAVSIV